MADDKKSVETSENTDIQENGNPVGKSEDTQESTSKAKGSKVDLDKLVKENEGLKSAQSTLTKKNEELTAKMDGLVSGLSNMVGSDDKEEEPSIEGLVSKLSERIDTFESEKIKDKAELAVSNAVSELADEEGNVYPELVRTKAMKLVDTNGLSADEAVSKLQEVAKELAEIHATSNKVTDNRPEGSANNKGRYSTPDVRVIR